MISKELLSEVLGFDCIDEKIEHDDYYITYFNTYLSIPQKVNIYELAHKCKEWAFENGYFVSSGFEITPNKKTYYCMAQYLIEKRWEDETDFADTEPEAIFKACEWILEQKDKA